MSDTVLITEPNLAPAALKVLQSAGLTPVYVPPYTAGDCLLNTVIEVKPVGPFAAAEDVYARTTAKQDAETRQMAAIEAGANDRTWVDAALRRLGCEIPEEL